MAFVKQTEFSVECINWLEEAFAENYFTSYDYSEFKNMEMMCSDSFRNTFRTNYKEDSTLLVVKSLSIKEIVNELKFQREIGSHENILRPYGISKIETASNSLSKYAKLDIYSVGVLLWQISITNGNREMITKNTPVEFSNLYTACCSEDPNNRPSIKRVVTSIKSMVEKVDQDLISRYRVALCYENGIGFQIDYEKAFNLYKSVAEKSTYNLAQYKCGFFYENEKGVKKDLMTAFKWYTVSANNGNKFAQYSLGSCYENGKGVDIDKEKSFIWYKQSAQQDYTDAQYKTGFFYEKGIGVRKDLKNASFWYHKSAKNGNKIAQFNLGRFYENGWNVEKDVIKAFECLGYFYENGIEVEKDYEIAFEWYRKSVVNGNKAAKIKLGFFYEKGNCYSKGIGTNADKEKAFELYLLAAEKGNAEAQNYLTLMDEHKENVHEINLNKNSLHLENVENIVVL
ncbi:15439_t:CDS:2 [Funneliformis geosporum]|uniref:15439_t:CDS:1 n=1 Tax=Funneliformis geosporum TaxID=1117311 RepID=A0A9W4SNW8_9GLOM|nr:15439_t:CDS:2 [Funneliformis geosporum]